MFKVNNKNTRTTPTPSRSVILINFRIRHLSQTLSKALITQEIYRFFNNDLDVRVCFKTYQCVRTLPLLCVRILLLCRDYY